MSRSEEHRADAEQCRRLAAGSSDENAVSALRRMAAIYDNLAIKAERMRSASKAK